jgi:hypothetical protein
VAGEDGGGGVCELYSNATAKKDKDRQIVVMFQVGTRCTFVRRRMSIESWCVQRFYRHTPTYNLRRVPFWNMTTQIDTDQRRHIFHAREPFASAPTFSRRATSDATLSSRLVRMVMWSWNPSLWKFPNKALPHTLTIPRTCVWRCAKSCPARGGACDDGSQSPGDNLDPPFWSVFPINISLDLSRLWGLRTPVTKP